MRTILLAAALAAGATAAHADSTWTFNYTGATSADAPFTLSTLSGSFTANDLDSNGRIDRSEVVSLEFFGYEVRPAIDITVPWGSAGQSELSSFSFDIATRALAFDAKAGEWHDAWIKNGNQLLYATGLGQFTFDLTPATLAVNGPGVMQLQSAAAVPEPGSWLLMCAGLAGLLCWASRRAPKPARVRLSPPER